MIDAQRTACRRAAAELGVHVVREYAEHGGTGRIDKRPELRLMLDELRMLRDVRYVITISCDRLWRQVADQAAIQFETDAAGTQLVFANELLGKPPQQREETSV
jgi:DNA invertase Pin-like site-specific DNA recombinase